MGCATGEEGKRETGNSQPCLFGLMWWVKRCFVGSTEDFAKTSLCLQFERKEWPNRFIGSEPWRNNRGPCCSTSVTFSPYFCHVVSLSCEITGLPCCLSPSPMWWWRRSNDRTQEQQSTCVPEYSSGYIFTPRNMCLMCFKKAPGLICWTCKSSELRKV